MQGKKILLGISGSIAAYKAASLVRLLVKAGAEVKVLMTDAATRFITPLTLSTLSKHEVLTDVVGEKGWNNHVELGLWADAYVIAPTTASTLAKLTHGICDNMLVAAYLSARCPVFVAPAMDVDMWHHPSTRRNLATLETDGVHVIPVGHGELASGLVGDGRMAEPNEIFDFINSFFQKKFFEKSILKNKKILITAGPTHEPLDPVRFVGNRSSGKMGVAIAEALVQRGAEVVLVMGPSLLRGSLQQLEKRKVQVIHVETAQEMFEAAKTHFQNCDAAILAAAVADYRPKNVASEKIKKKTADLVIELESTPDIAKYLGSQKTENQILIGFALETNNELENAIGKLERKNFDFIVLNSLNDKGAGFATDTNKVTMIFAPDARVQTFDLKDKLGVGNDIAEALSNVFEQKNGE
jgi:phosphopantothenoylcysteine decarboxylase/phosphopantothenate--cysteine ligase